MGDSKRPWPMRLETKFLSPRDVSWDCSRFADWVARCRGDAQKIGTHQGDRFLCREADFKRVKSTQRPRRKNTFPTCHRMIFTRVALAPTVPVAL